MRDVVLDDLMVATHRKIPSPAPDPRAQARDERIAAAVRVCLTSVEGAITDCPQERSALLHSLQAAHSALLSARCLQG